MTSSQVLIAHAVKVQAFPGAQSAARRVVFALLAVISLALIGVPSGLSAGSPALYSDALFVPFLLTFTTLLRLLQIYGWEILPLVRARCVLAADGVVGPCRVRAGGGP